MVLSEIVVRFATNAAIFTSYGLEETTRNIYRKGRNKIPGIKGSEGARY